MEDQSNPMDPVAAAQPAAQPTSDERLFGMLCHLIALVSHFIGPLIIWLIKKDQSKFVDYHGKESLNFQFNVLGYFVILWALTLVTCGIGALLTVPLMAAVGVYVLVVVIIAGIKANGGEYFRYPATIRIL